MYVCPTCPQPEVLGRIGSTWVDRKVVSLPLQLQAREWVGSEEVVGVDPPLDCSQPLQVGLPTHPHSQLVICMSR
jgi:hypothetical protein